MGGLGNAVSVASIVPLHILLQMHLELSVCICGARYTSEGIFTAAWAKLLGHVFCGEKTTVTAFDEGLEMADSLKGSCREQVEVHLK